MRLSFFTVSLATSTLVKASQLRAADSAPILLPLHLYTRQILNPVLVGNATSTDDTDTGFLPVTVSPDQQCVSFPLDQFCMFCAHRRRFSSAGLTMQSSWLGTSVFESLLTQARRICGSCPRHVRRRRVEPFRRTPLRTTARPSSQSMTIRPCLTLATPMGQVQSFICFSTGEILKGRLTAATGFIARETVQLSNLTVPNQAFGEKIRPNSRPPHESS
jgi:hypothetical protein